MFTIVTEFVPLPQQLDFKERWARATLMQMGHKLRTCVIQPTDAKQLKPDLHYVLLQELPPLVLPEQIPALFQTIAIPTHFILKSYPRQHKHFKGIRKYAYIGFQTVDPIIHIILHHKTFTTFNTKPILARFIKLLIIKYLEYQYSL